MLGLLKRTNKEYLSAETVGSALEVLRHQVKAAQLIRKYQMQSRVGFGISSQDWNYSETEGNKTSFIHNVEDTGKLQIQQ